MLWDRQNLFIIAGFVSTYFTVSNSAGLSYVVRYKRVLVRAGFVIVEGGIGIFGFADWANFWFGFSVFALKKCGFPVLVFRAVCGFSPI